MNGPSMIDSEMSGFRDGEAWGPLAEAWASGAEIEVVYAEGADADAGHPLDWMPRHALAPTVTWNSGTRSGPFSLADFLAMHADPGERDFDLRVEGRDHLPFLALHPSGQMQAIRYDPYAERFKRRILYATLRLESAVALAMGTAGGPEEDPRDDRDEK